MSLADDLRALRDQCDNGTITPEQFEARRKAMIGAFVEAIDLKYYPKFGEVARVAEGAVQDRWRINRVEWVVVGEMLVRFRPNAAVHAEIGDRLVVAGVPRPTGLSAMVYRNETSGYNGIPEGRRWVSKNDGSQRRIHDRHVRAGLDRPFCNSWDPVAGLAAWSLSIGLDTLQERLPRNAETRNGNDE